MATQGMITITKDKTVVIKIITGSDGYNAKKVAESIKKIGESILSSSLSEIYDLSVKGGFAESASLVVINKEREYFKGDGKVPLLYRKTFQVPKFNPRWESGETEYFEMISF